MAALNRPVGLEWRDRPRESPPRQATQLQHILNIPATKQDVGSLRLIAGDALQVADQLLAEGRAASFDLIHLDPPFGSEADYARARQMDVAGKQIDVLLPAYGDTDRGDIASYLDGLFPIFQRCHALLSPRGSFYLHLDFRRGPYVRLLLDEIFGVDNLLNEIIWAYGLGGSSATRFQRKHDVIYFYAKDLAKNWFVAPQEAATSSLLAGQPKRATDLWQTPTAAPGGTILRTWPDPLIERTLSNRDFERTGYPTQKPLSLAARIVQASLPPNGQVLDLMSGSGTIGIAALHAGGHATLGDRGALALDVSRGRAHAIGAQIALDAVNGALQSTELPAAPLRIEGNNAVLRAFTLPWPPPLLPIKPAVSGWLTDNHRLHGVDFLSAWGVFGRATGNVLSALAWWDAAAQRKREKVQTCLVFQADRVPEMWVGVDVFGRIWHTPI